VRGRTAHVFLSYGSVAEIARKSSLLGASSDGASENMSGSVHGEFGLVYGWYYLGI
jgi:hypothetical protein